MAGDPLKKGRYTNFGNKIGLFSNKTGNFICNSPEVVLNFPFKDTVLEAGMTKEDSSREERFLHIEMDAKDIDTLEDPKVLTNFKYSKAPSAFCFCYAASAPVGVRRKSESQPQAA